MGQVIKNLKGLFGGGSQRDARMNRIEQAQEAAANRRLQEAGQIQSLQQSGQQSAELDKGIARSRKANRGRQLLLGADGGKATVG